MMDDEKMRKHYPEHSANEFEELRRVATPKWNSFLAAVQIALVETRKYENRQQGEQSLVGMHENSISVP